MMEEQAVPQTSANEPQKPVTEKVPEKVQENVQHAVEQAQQEVASSREPWYLASKRALILVGFNITLFVLFTFLAIFVSIHPVNAIDVAITREFQEQNIPWLRDLMIVVSYLGNNFPIFIVLIGLAALVLWVVDLRLEALLVITLSTVSTLLNGLIKLLVGRPRPAAPVVEIIQAASGQSFPSGHVMSYVAFWGLLFSLVLILFKRDRWWHYVLLVIPALFVILVGPSRIYLGDHWASDVLGGYLFGGLLLGISLWIYFVLKNRGFLAPKIPAGQPVSR